MSDKITSAEAHEEMKRLGDRVLRQDGFDRREIQSALDALESGIGAEVPSGKSYLDWARREGIVEAVSRGNYRWADVTGAAEEIGRQIAQESREDVTVTDMDPEHPMHQEDDDLDTIRTEDEFLGMFEGLISDLADSMAEEDRTRAIAHELEEMVEDTGTADILIHDVPRLPRKMKKRMKRDIINGTGARKVIFRFDKATR